MCVHVCVHAFVREREREVKNGEKRDGGKGFERERGRIIKHQLKLSAGILMHNIIYHTLEIKTKKKKRF